MDSTPVLVPPEPAPSPAATTAPAGLGPAVIAIIECILVCGVPTQLVIVVLLTYFAGVPILEGQHVSTELFALSSLLDTAAIALLIKLFLSLSGETSRDVFLGRRSPAREARFGLLLLPVVFIAIGALAYGLRTLMPWLHTVEENPFELYMKTPVDAAIFTVVVIIAGGVREELQRGFILHRFRQRLGGAWVGLFVFGALFGALHLTEGVDAAIAIGVLGLFWGALYIKRGSSIAPMVNHAGFDALQVLQAILVRGFS
jgi:membrane protease YdiL (CAAX protease family)